MPASWLTALRGGLGEVGIWIVKSVTENKQLLSMGHIKNYKEGQFAQINLDDGNKVLLSCGHADMKVFLLGPMSLPKRTIHTFSSQFLYDLLQKVGYDMGKDEVEIVANELAKATTPDDIKKICEDLEKDKDFLKQL